jgi:hypothetical protein
VLATLDESRRLIQLDILSPLPEEEPPAVGFQSRGIASVSGGTLVLIEGHVLPIGEGVTVCGRDDPAPIEPAAGVSVVVDRNDGALIRIDCFAFGE